MKKKSLVRSGAVATICAVTLGLGASAASADTSLPCRLTKVPSVTPDPNALTVKIDLQTQVTCFPPS
jgi:hypothetical protein